MTQNILSHATHPAPLSYILVLRVSQIGKLAGFCIYHFLWVVGHSYLIRLTNV